MVDLDSQEDNMDKTKRDEVRRARMIKQAHALLSQIGTQMETLFVAVNDACNKTKKVA